MLRVKPILLITIFLTTMFIVPSTLVIGSFNDNATMMSFDGSLESQALISQLSHNARVAIYDEDNLTVPAISSAENLTNNIAEITTLLEGAGHTVDALTEVDILNHELITADYDVFILVNNLPRPSISKLVKEFWLGGGSLLTFNGALSYLWYEEIIFPGYAADPRPSSWDYLPSDELNVSARHPTMKDFHINDTVTQSSNNWAVIAQAIMDVSDISNSLTTLLNNATTPNHVSAFALEISFKGGRIVHLPGNGASIASDMESIIIDSVEWLIPQAKGRIAFDLTHQPRLCVDSWDIEFATGWWTTNNFGQFRTLAVNHTYTFDKLYPSASGNITADRLANYDVLLIDWPDLNYTSAEGIVIEEWVNGGGSLLVLGDRTELVGPNRGDLSINMVLQNFDMSLGTSDEAISATVDPGTHVTLEGCTGLYVGLSNYLSVIGNATAIWHEGANILVAGQEFGQGRAILSADMNIFDNSQLGDASNRRFALNALNWLTAADAEILVYSSFWYNLQNRDPVMNALRDMELSYQSFTTSEYIDDFIDSKDWGLFILNEVNYALTGLELDEIYAYVDAGGELLMSYYDMDGHPSHPLWSKMGVEWAETVTGSPSVYIWDTTHSVFTTPNDHSTNNFTSGTLMSDDGDAVTVKAGYTALAGITAADTAGKAAIVVSNDRTTLFNPFLIDNFNTDSDDDTYEDRVELWENEITFIMSTGTGGLPFNLDTTTLIIIGAVVLGLVIVIVLVRRRGGSKPKPKKRRKK